MDARQRDPFRRITHATNASPTNGDCLRSFPRAPPTRGLPSRAPLSESVAGRSTARWYPSTSSPTSRARAWTAAGASTAYDAPAGARRWTPAGAGEAAVGRRAVAWSTGARGRVTAQTASYVVSSARSVPVCGLKMVKCRLGFGVTCCAWLQRQDRRCTACAMKSECTANA